MVLISEENVDMDYGNDNEDDIDYKDGTSNVDNNDIHDDEALGEADGPLEDKMSYRVLLLAGVVRIN
jgi:hypothetical protein